MVRLVQMLAMVVLAVMLAGCATLDPSPDYTGADAGFLVVAMGEGADTFYGSYKLFYRNKADTKITGRVYFPSGLWAIKMRDYYRDDDRGGLVLIKKLPPGDYELVNFEIYNDGLHGPGGAQLTSDMWWKSKEDFSIPFKISEGAATYVGEFKAVGMRFHPFLKGKYAVGGAYFVVSDKSDRDVAIAKQKQPAIKKVELSVPNVDALNNPLLRSKESPPVMESWMD